MSVYQKGCLTDLIINSSELGVAKPDKEFWEIAFTETKKLVPELTFWQVLVIDDSRTNCQSAEDFGFQTFLYNNEKKSNKELLVILS